MYDFYPCEPVVPFDNGQNDVKDGSVENYDFDWNEQQPDAPEKDCEKQEETDDLPQ